LIVIQKLTPAHATHEPAANKNKDPSSIYTAQPPPGRGLGVELSALFCVLLTPVDLSFSVQYPSINRTTNRIKQY
jgi:hypothetical protein